MSFLIMLYSLEYMKHERGLTRCWFWMSFFIGNTQLIDFSDNFLPPFFGWEVWDFNHDAHLLLAFG